LFSARRQFVVVQANSAETARKNVDGAVKFGRGSRQNVVDDLHVHLIELAHDAPFLVAPRFAGPLGHNTCAGLTQWPRTTMSDCLTLADIVVKYGPTADAKDVAEFLGFHVDTVYEMVADGRLRGYCANGKPFVRSGKRGRKGLHIFVRSVQEFIERCNARSMEEAPPPPVVEEAAAPQPEIKKPSRRQGKTKTKILLPFPGQSRSATA
jgi:excisionase family DNA binding protein